MMIFTRAYTAALLGIAALAVTACAGGDTTPEPETGSDAEAKSTLSKESLKMAETAWLSISADGEVFTTYLDSDGRYRDLHEGELRYSGSWEQNENSELCFSPDMGEVSCWSHGLPRLDGTMRATTAGGRAIEVKKVAYAPPPSGDDAAPSEQDTAPEDQG